MEITFSTLYWGPLLGRESGCLHLFSSPEAAVGIDWFSRALDARGPPQLPAWTPPPRAAICFAVCLPVSRPASLFPSDTSPLPSRSAPSPSPQLGDPNHPRPLPRRQADTRQIGIRERKGGKATPQPSNKGAIKVAPEWRAQDESARKSESELAITRS